MSADRCELREAGGWLCGAGSVARAAAAIWPLPCEVPRASLSTLLVRTAWVLGGKLIPVLSSHYLSCDEKKAPRQRLSHW